MFCSRAVAGYRKVLAKKLLNTSDPPANSGFVKGKLCQVLDVPCFRTDLLPLD